MNPEGSSNLVCENINAADELDFGQVEFTGVFGESTNKEIDGLSEHEQHHDHKVSVPVKKLQKISSGQRLFSTIMIWVQSKIFLDAKQSFCSNICSAKKEVYSNIWSAKQDFCSNYFGCNVLNPWVGGY